MRKYLLAAAAAVAFATPAMARDHSPYVGVEGGLMLVEDMEFDLRSSTTTTDAFLTVDHKRGFDVDVVAGQDFGAFRAELELGWKRASHKDYRFADSTGLDVVNGDGNTRVLSLMGNGLFDFGGDDGQLRGFLGGGAGVARTRLSTDGAHASRTGFAYQAIAGVAFPVSTNVEVGLKYRFFNTRLKDDFDDADLDITNGSIRSRFRSHSLLASLIFNLGAPAAPPPPPPAPPPPPPPPPATQTCPDGSVILTTDTCPVPPPPPPPPAPAPERG